MAVWPRAVVVALALALLGIVVRSTAAETDATRSETLPQLPAQTLTDLAGRQHRLAADKDVRLWVVVFLGTECPVSNGYAPALRRLHDQFSSRGVQLLGVHCDPDVSADVARKHAAEFRIDFPLVLDHQQRLALACGVRVVPTAVVMRADGQVVYRGRIDNRYAVGGQRRLDASEFDLRDAIAATLDGRTIEVPIKPSFGCPLPALKTK